MTTATLFKPDLWAPLRHLLQWMLPTGNTAHTAQAPIKTNRHNAPIFVAARATSTRASTCLEPKRKPLRIVRVLESGQHRTSVGRMVISGRMADVCAELDRLAACEAT